MILSKKISNIAPSLTLEITAKANKLKKEGVKVISFGAGEPDFNTPENIQEAAISAMKKGYTKYTAASGIAELKKAVCDKLYKDNNIKYNENQVVISNGAKQSIANTFLSILNPSDEVLISSPYWVTYPELVKLADGIPVFIPSTEENSFKVTAIEFEKYITDKTKAILINSPNNPTGSVYTLDELKDIAKLAKKYNLFIISDEIYEKLIYGDEKHISIASLSEDAYSRTIVINGVSKSYSMTGWRIGYTASSAEIAKLMGSLQSHFTSNPNTIAQWASLEAITGNQDMVYMMRDEFKKRRDYMVDRINKISGISCNNPAGAFYIMMNIKEIIGKKYEGFNINSAFEFSKLLLDKKNVAVVPGEAFGVNNYLRLSYATSMENIVNGLDRIEELINQII